VSGLFGTYITTPLWWGTLVFSNLSGYHSISLQPLSRPPPRLSFVTHLLRFEAYQNTPNIRVKLSCMSSFSSVCCPLYVLTTPPHLHSTSIIMYP